jgi:hypothetical protein
MIKLLRRNKKKTTTTILRADSVTIGRNDREIEISLPSVKEVGTYHKTTRVTYNDNLKYTQQYYKVTLELTVPRDTVERLEAFINPRKGG